MCEQLSTALSLAEKQISQMLTMQDAMNSRVSDTWRDNGYEWYRAIWVEVRGNVRSPWLEVVETSRN